MAGKTATILDRAGRSRQIVLPKQGSAFRNGDRTCYLGFPTGTSIADAASGTLQEMSIVESGILDRFFIQSRNRVALTTFTVNGSPLISGSVPASIFGPDSLHNPYCGLFVDQTTKVRYLARNESGGAVIPTAGFSVAQAGSPVLSQDHGLLAVGGPSLTSISTASSGTATFTIERPALLDRLIIDYGGTSIVEVDLFVTSIKYDGDELVGSGSIPIAMFNPENPFNPSLGIYVEPGHTLTVTVYNQDAAQTAELYFGFTVKR